MKGNILKELRHKIQYKIWITINRKSKAKYYARIATKRGDFKEAALFWEAAEKFFPNDPECVTSREVCLLTLSGKNFLNYAAQEELLREIQSLIDQKLFGKALVAWDNLWQNNPSPSERLYTLSGEIFKQIVYNNLEFSNKNVELKLFEFLCYQSPILIKNTNLYPVICNILFRHRTSDKPSYEKFQQYIRNLTKDLGIIADKNVSSACLTISFDLIDKDRKTDLIDLFFEEFLFYKQWGMLLFSDNTENIEIFQKIITKRIDNLDKKTAEEIFNYLYLVSATTSINSNIYQDLIKKIKNLETRFDPEDKFAADFEYFSGEKDLYKECVKSLNLENVFPKNSSPAQNKLRIAICVSGQLRGYKKALKSWKNLGAENHELTYFVHTWKYVGRKYPNPPSDSRSISGRFLEEWRKAWFKLEEAVMKERYKNFFKIFSDGDIVTEDDLKKLYGAKNVIIEDDHDKKFEHFSNAEKMHYKVYECHKLARNSGQDFDLIIRIRPDRELIVEGEIDWKKIYDYLAQKNRLIVDSGPYLHPHAEYVIGDQIAIGTSNMMDRYAMTYKITQYLQKASITNLPKEHLPHTNFAYTTLYQNIEIENFSKFHPNFLNCGNLLDPELLSPHEILEAIKNDVKDSKNDIDLALLEAATYDFKNNIS